MSVESVTQAVSGLALAFSDQDDATYAMVNSLLNWYLVVSMLYLLCIYI